MIKIIIAAVVIAILPTLVTVSTAITNSSTHAAPAPLLAASVPAFLAVGGGGAVSWLLRRRKNTGTVAQTNKA
jgi:hypothetical protein